MADRAYKNVKRFVDDISKEVKDAMSGGGEGGSGFQMIPSGSTITVHLLELKKILVANGIDIDMDFIGDAYIYLGAYAEDAYMGGGGFRSLRLYSYSNSDTNYRASISGDYGDTDEKLWDTTEDHSEAPSLDRVLTTGGDVDITVKEDLGFAFAINLSLGTSSSGKFIILTSEEISKVFEIKTNTNANA